MNYKKILLVALMITLPVFSCATVKIDINTATLEELYELSGIGPKYAQAILEGRPYSSIDDLLQIKGIGEKTLEKIKKQGLACVNCTTISQSSKAVEVKHVYVGNENDYFRSIFSAVFLALFSGFAVATLRVLTKKI